jgi:hypothetical protein
VTTQVEEFDNDIIQPERSIAGMVNKPLNQFITEWATIYEDEPEAAVRTEDDIISNVLQSDSNDNEEEEDDSEASDQLRAKVTPTQALQAASVLQSYFEQEGYQIRIQQLITIQQEIRKKQMESKRQTSIRDWFKKPL